MRYKDSRTSVEVSLESSLISHHISLIIALACIAVYAFALIFAGMRIFHMINGQQSLAQQEFADLVTYTTTEGNRSFMSERFQTNVTNALKLSKTLQAAIISNASSEYGFERLRESGIIWNGGKPIFKNILGFSKKPLFAPLAIEDQRNVTIRVIYNFFDYKSLIIILKQTLAIVVVGFCISCITLLLRYLLVKDTIPVIVGGAPHKRKDAFNAPGATGGKTGHAAQSTSDDDDSFSDIFEEEDSDLPQDSYNESVVTEPPVLHSPVSQAESDNMPLRADISEDELAGLFPQEDEPTYTDLGINWETSLIRKLEDELYRSESFNQDLALIIVKATDDPSGTILPILASEAIDFFVLRDLIFEKDDAGVTVIAQNTDIEAAFTKSTEFRAALLEKHPEQNLKLFVGVSSRCDRDEVEPNRLIREAEAALEKASETTPIVAFRVDPEKYKEFLKKQGNS
ncbi:MAG: hypothetical protein LBD58_01570 [Treponema sp.]|jgi:hypothetical protein|nr:hypothetical protein [Treponema sp.]